MSREWKPGDVAIIRAQFGPDGDGEHEYAACRHESAWALLRGDEEEFYRDGDIPGCEPVRPLVVIDPEDREAVERLLSYYVAPFEDFVTDGRMDHMQAALREFANPTPAKPDEPTGLGAVVEDEEGKRWLRLDSGRWDHNWTSIAWDDIAVVRVLSEGVQP